MKKILLDQQKAFISELTGGGGYWFPVSDDRGRVNFRYQTEVKPPVRPEKSTLSPKHLFFPQTECILTWDRNGETSPNPDKVPIVVLGLRQCDASGLLLLDKVFSGSGSASALSAIPDPYWKSRYENALLVVWVCDAPDPTCFCRWFGNHEGEGADLRVFEIDEVWFVEGCSQRGMQVLSEMGETFPEATREDETILAQWKETAELKFRNTDDGFTLPETLKGGLEPAGWEKLAENCVNCGLCTFACPTCHCFDVQDEGRPEAGTRLRLWDSCMMPQFTCEASGHNPRGLSTQRVRQRFMHKLVYFPEKNGEFLCTGCGRCITLCPVGMDIRKVIRRLAESGGTR